MNKTLQYLTVTTLAAGLAAGLGWSKGKPGGGGGDTSTPVEAHFTGALSEDGIGSYSAELPATGNFTMDLRGTGRFLNLGFSDPSLPAEAEVFMSINRQCLEGGLNGDGSCADFGLTEGSLKAMTVGGTPLLLGVHMQFANPDNRRTSYWVKCGASGGDAPDEVSELGTDLVRATCEFDDENGCTEWHLTPASGAMEDLNCRVLEKSNKSLTIVGDDENLSFDLRLYRDQP